MVGVSFVGRFDFDNLISNNNFHCLLSAFRHQLVQSFDYSSLLPAVRRISLMNAAATSRRLFAGASMPKYKRVPITGWSTFSAPASTRLCAGNSVIFAMLSLIYSSIPRCGISKFTFSKK